MQLDEEDSRASHEQAVYGCLLLAAIGLVILLGGALGAVRVLLS